MNVVLFVRWNFCKGYLRESFL